MNAVVLALLVPAYNRDLSHWLSVAVPPKAQRVNRAVWEYAANYSKMEWRVVVEKGIVRASLGGDKPSLPPSLPTKLTTFHSALRVEDGWLLGANHGEWGGSLSWASLDGKLVRKVSDDQIVAFFRLPSGPYAVEGLAHFSMSVGSVLRLTESNGTWRTTKVATLPDAPFAVATRHDGTALLVLLNGIATFEPNSKIRIVSSAPWWGLYPNSAVLSDDESKLYIGMRQFVGEYNLRTRVLRLLVPSKAFLNRLSKDDERTIRAQAGD